MAKYYVISCHVLHQEMHHFASLSKNEFEFQFLKQGLHNTPDVLHSELQDAIDSIKGGYDAILIGYGLCCNGIDGITAPNHKLVFMRGHDCITFLVGSRQQYKTYFDAHPGTYWYSPGWIETGSQPGKERYGATLNKYIKQYGEENAKYLMEMEQGWFKEYSNAAYVDLGFGDNSKLKEYTRECAQWLGWEYDELSGDPRLITDFLNGNWNTDDFLVLEPGETVAVTHDERVIDKKTS
jgi:hypothetical protein